jgi:hypothetical protein
MGGKVIVLLVAMAAGAGLLAGCGAADPGDGGGQRAAVAKQPNAIAPAEGQDDKAKAPKDDADKKAPVEGDSSDGPKPVVLTAEERQKLGIATAPAQAVTFNDSSTAFGVVLGHETIAQSVADLETAAGAARFSEVALTRAQKLANGPGALGTDTLENLQKQRSTDLAALSLARRKATAVVGVRFPWQGAAGDSDTLDALASGEAKLLRATFPSGEFVGATPKALRLLPLEAGAEPSPTANSPPRMAHAATPDASLTASPVWDAPQDPNLPGRSFFALIRNPDIAEGSRFQVIPSSPTSGETGILVPATAVVVTGGQYWCYLEKKTGTFTRVPIVIDKPLGPGYFVNDGIGLSDGDPIVTAAAGLLLAREMNAASGPDD